MTNQIALRKDAQPPSSGEWQIMKEQTTMLVETGFLPYTIKNPQQAMAIILIGRELGIPTMAALNNINVIQQKPTVSPQLMVALIERSGQLENMIVKNHNSPDGVISQVSCTMKRKGRTEHTEIFGSKEANALGLLGKDNYKKQPATMFKWRAVAACARVVFPDVILGLYTPEEMGAEVEISDTEEICARPEESRAIIVKMPEPVSMPEPQTPEAKSDYSAEWEQALSGVKTEKLSPVGAVPPEQRIDESQELIAEIKWLLSELGKEEVAFQKWFEGKYSTDMQWENSGVAVKREISVMLHGWIAQRKAA